MEAMYESREQTLKLTEVQLSHLRATLVLIACILFTRVKFTCVRTLKLRDSGNAP